MIIISKIMHDNVILVTPYSNIEICITEFGIEEMDTKFSCHIKCLIYNDMELVYYWSFGKINLNLIETTYFRYK